MLHYIVNSVDVTARMQAHAHKQDSTYWCRLKFSLGTKANYEKYKVVSTQVVAYTISSKAMS